MRKLSNSQPEEAAGCVEKCLWRHEQKKKIINPTRGDKIAQ